MANIGEWTEEQLERFIENQINQHRFESELPPNQDTSGQRKSATVDDLLIHEGNLWLPYTMPAARVWRNSVQGMSAGGATPISWNVEVFDKEKQAPGMWDPANPTRLTVFQQGWYIFHGLARFESGTTGATLKIRHTNRAGVQNLIAEGNVDALVRMQVTTMFYMFKTEYVELLAGHTNIAARNIETEDGSENANVGVTPLFTTARIP